MVRNTLDSPCTYRQGHLLIPIMPVRLTIKSAHGQQLHSAKQKIVSFSCMASQKCTIVILPSVLAEATLQRFAAPWQGHARTMGLMIFGFLALARPGTANISKQVGGIGICLAGCRQFLAKEVFPGLSAGGSATRMLHCLRAGLEFTCEWINGVNQLRNLTEKTRCIGRALLGRKCKGEGQKVGTESPKPNMLPGHLQPTVGPCKLCASGVSPT